MTPADNTLSFSQGLQKQSAKCQWLIFLGSSIRQSPEPNSSATGLRLQSHSECSRAFGCNNRTGFRI